MPDINQPESLAARLDTADGITIEDLHQALDALDDAGRHRFVLAFRKQRHERLYKMADGHMEASLEMMVPADASAGTTCIWEGRNSMAMFNLFQKRFTRPEGQDVVWGYNEQSFRWFTGPGFFVGRVEPDRGILYLDYGKQPPQAPAGWPVVKANKGFPRGIVYGYDDEVRPVARDVVIGTPLTTTAAGTQYFVACRGEMLPPQ